MTLESTTSEPHDSIVAIDGPAGAGKSSVARKVARELGFFYLDTGSMYRAVTLHCLRQGLHGDPGEEAAVSRLLSGMELAVDAQGGVWLGPGEVTPWLRSEEVSRHVSAISAMLPVRTALVALQRRIAVEKVSQGSGIVVDGRDIGSHVFPRARHRFYLDAAVEERAARRKAQEGGQGPLEDWIGKIQARDRVDSQRALAPLCIPDGAVVVDTTRLSEDEVVALIVRAVRS